MPKGNDIRLDIYVNAETYLALRKRCEDEDRSMTQHVRHLIRRDLEAFVSQMSSESHGKDAGNMGESARDE